MRGVMPHEDSRKNIVINSKSAVLISFILVLPFAIMQALNNPITKQNATGIIVLFGLLWLLPIAFIVILLQMVQTMRAGNSVMANPISLLFKVVLLVLIATMWGGILIDQIPCFLGVPNCD